MKRITSILTLAFVLAVILSEYAGFQSDLFIRVLAQQTVPANIRTVSLTTNDIIYDPVSQKLYASQPSSAGANGNSITVIDPVAGTIGPSVFVGSEPTKLAISDDGKYLYVSLEGAASVRRVHLPTLTPDLQFALGNDSFSGPYYVDDMEVRPGCSEEIAVSLRNRGFSPRHEGVATYLNGQRRQKMTPDHTGSNVIDFCNQASRLYGYNTESTEYGFRRMTVDETGVTVIDVTQNVLSGFGNDFACDGGLAYSRSGSLYNPRTKALLGTFSGLQSGALVRPDSAVARVFFLMPSSSSSSSLYRVTAYDQERFVPLGFFEIPNVSGSPTSFVRWGADGVAFRTAGQIFLARSSLINAATGEMLSNSSAASFRSARLARESIVSAFGAKLATGTVSASFTPLPTSLMGTTVSIKDSAGTERLAPLFFVSPMQVNYQVPAGTAIGTAMVTVTAGDGTITRGTSQISAVAPALFSANATGQGVPAGVALRVSPGNIQTYEPIGMLDMMQNRFVTKTIDLGTAQEQVILVLFGTGIRFNTLESLAARIGCADVPVLFAGAQGDLVGVDQVNLAIPRSLIGSGEVDVVLTMNGQTSNVVRVNIK